MLKEQAPVAKKFHPEEPLAGYVRDPDHYVAAKEMHHALDDSRKIAYAAQYSGSDADYEAGLQAQEGIVEVDDGATKVKRSGYDIGPGAQLETYIETGDNNVTYSTELDHRMATDKRTSDGWKVNEDDSKPVVNVTRLQPDGSRQKNTLTGKRALRAQDILVQRAERAARTEQASRLAGTVATAETEVDEQ